jgi:hypothetical protein
MSRLTGETFNRDRIPINLGRETFNSLDRARPTRLLKKKFNKKLKGEEKMTYFMLRINPINPLLTTS